MIMYYRNIIWLDGCIFFIIKYEGDINIILKNYI